MNATRLQSLYERLLFFYVSLIVASTFLALFPLRFFDLRLRFFRIVEAMIGSAASTELPEPFEYRCQNIIRGLNFFVIKSIYTHVQNYQFGHFSCSVFLSDVCWAYGLEQILHQL